MDKNLTRREIAKVAEDYSLGQVRKTRVLDAGWVNHSYDVSTNKGNYIIQVLGSKYDDWKKNKMNMQFAVLSHLRKKGFPYEIPEPLTNSNQENISHFSRDRHLWVYKKIEGETVKGLNRLQFTEAMKGLALFDRYAQDFKWPGEPKSLYFEWTLEGYRRLEKITPKNRTDRLVLKNLDLLNEYVANLKKIDFSQRVQLIQGDFNDGNILFKGNKLVGVIDFDNTEFAPLTKDVALACKRIKYPQHKIDDKKIPLYVKEYRKFGRFSKEDEKLMIPCLLLEDCTLVKWLYWHQEKHLNERYEAIADTIDQTKLLASWMGWRTK